MTFCDKLIVAVGVNPAKKTLFSEEERVKQITSAITSELDFLTSTNVVASSFQGLLVNYAKEVDAQILIRGIRSVSDFEYEINLAGINKTLTPKLETVFLPTSPELAVVSSSMVKEIFKHGGDIKKFVPQGIVKDLGDKFGFVKTGKTCSKCGKSDNLKLTDDKPPFTYCRVCGVVV
jgi:pantetheine-phosphate adenylyltransferase, bacterial